MHDGKSKPLTPEQLVKSLRACAGSGSECRYCAKEVGYGCARDLKVEAANLIEEWIEERGGKQK